MSSYYEKIKKCKVLSLVFAVVISLITIQPGFVNMVYPDVPEKEVKIEQDNQHNNTTDNESIVAHLNGVPISTRDLLKRYNLFIIMSGAVEPSVDRVSVNTYLDSYLVELLLIQEARKMGITIKPGEVEQEKKNYFEKNNLTEDDILKKLSGLKLSMEDVDNYFENNLCIFGLGSKKFGDRDISDKEAREYYTNNKKYYNRPETVALSHILICHEDSSGCSSDLDKTQAKKLAENIRKLATPENFAELAKQYSTDRTGETGGDLGYISRGEAIPSIEEAAFKPGKREISDVVETEFGYHIIFVRRKLKALSMTFEEAKDTITKNIKDNDITSKLLTYSLQLLQTADIKRFTSDPIRGAGDTAGKTGDGESGEKALTGPSKFRTFKNTGLEINVNSKGQPVILLFTSVGCSHCQWIAETYDTTVMEYVENGLIEAHHYVMDSNDDLLTVVNESEIPPEYLKIKEERSNDLVPYFNFGGSYERIGTGYEAQDDFFAEEMEMRQVIDSLLVR